MSRRYYIAVVHKDENSDYGISFPDLPCISAGDTFEEAIVMGEEAAGICLQALAERGMDLPEPSSAEAVMSDPDYADGRAVVIGVEAPEPAREAA